MIYDIIQQNSVCEIDELPVCTNYWIMCTSSNYSEDRQLCAKLCVHTIASFHYPYWTDNQNFSR